MKLTYEQLETKVKILENKIKKMNDMEKEISNHKQFLNILLDTIPNPVFFKDTNGIYQTLNDAFSKTILGIPKERIIGKSLFDLPDEIPFELAKLYEKKDKELFNNPGTQVYEGSVKCANKEIRTFYFYKATVFNIHNEIIGLVGVMLDVTDLKKSQIQLDEQNKLLTKLSYLDSLTGLFNRRKFDEVFKYKIENKRDNEQIVNFILIDVDSFKKYNDEYGHLEGDNVLKIISNEIKKLLLRENDYLFRIGGEEFALIFDSNSIKYAKEFAEKIRIKIESLNILHENNFNYNRVTVSLGMICMVNEITNFELIYEKADKELYKAKRGGRNRVSYGVL